MHGNTKSASLSNTHLIHCINLIHDIQDNDNYPILNVIGFKLVLQNHAWQKIGWVIKNWKIEKNISEIGYLNIIGSKLVLQSLD